MTAPDGSETILPMAEVAPGRYETTYQAPDIGLYRLKEGDLERVTALGPAAPKEFEDAIATEERLAAAVTPTLGGFQWIETGTPSVRQVRGGRPASGRGWIGITPRNAYQTLDVRIAPLLPAWAFLLLAALFSLAAWMREGRR